MKTRRPRWGRRFRDAALFLAAFAAAARGEDRVRVGYFPNLTHAVALVGLERGIFQQALGTDVTIGARVFNAGPAEIEAVFAGEIDVGYIGPGPAINGFVRSRGKALRVVAAAACGGVSFVVRADSGITGAADLAGKRLAAPQIGNTQDVALRTFVRGAGLTTADKGGNVTVLPLANPDILTLFVKKEIDGAWVPEPWATLLRNAGGREVLDERTLWPGGKLPTAVVIVSTRFLAEQGRLLERWLRGHEAAVRWVTAHPEEAKRALNDAIRTLTTKEIPAAVLDEAWSRIGFDDAVRLGDLEKLARDAQQLGYLPTAEVAGIVDPVPLEKAKAPTGH